MKLFLFLLITLSLSSCMSYTLKNDFEEDIKLGKRTLKSSQCRKLSSSDFPLELEVGGEKKTYEGEADHLIVTKEGLIEKAKSPCKKRENKNKSQGKRDEESGGRENAQTSQTEESEEGEDSEVYDKTKYQTYYD